MNDEVVHKLFSVWEKVKSKFTLSINHLEHERLPARPPEQGHD